MSELRWRFYWSWKHGIGHLGLGDYGGEYSWRWAARLRCWLSFGLGIGQWFYSHEECANGCGATAEDVDYHFVRVGRRKARCQDEKDCAENRADLPATEGAASDA